MGESDIKKTLHTIGFIRAPACENCRIYTYNLMTRAAKQKDMLDPSKNKPTE